MWRLVAILGVLPLVSCGTASMSLSRGSAPAGASAGLQGGGSEVVFHGPWVAGADELAGDEVSRRDAAMNVREPVTAFGSDSWPAAPAAALDDAAYLYLPRNPHTVIYFNTRYPRGRGGAYGGDLYFYQRSWE